MRLSLLQPYDFQLLGLPARLARPVAVLLLAALLVAAVLWLRQLVRRRRQLAAWADASRRDRLAPGAGIGRDLWGGLPGLVGLVLLCISAAQPQCGTRTEPARRLGMDVVVAIDASRSMLARDVPPSRLERARLELSGLIDRLGGDRVGIVAFAGQAFVQCPLTSDHAAAKLFLRAVDPSAMPSQGTDLAAALRTAGALFEGADRGPSGKAVVLITDGEDHEGDVLPTARKLAEQGVRVFALGVGSPAGEPIPVADEEGTIVGHRENAEGEVVLTRLNEQVLREVADATGGRYLHADQGDLGVAEVSAELARMDKAEYETRMTVQYEERFGLFAAIGLALVALSFLVGEGRLRRRGRDS